MSIPRRLPSAPLLDRIQVHRARYDHLSERLHAESIGISYRTLERMKAEQTVSFSTADRVCGGLGLWLDTVYGETWDQEVAS